MCDIVSVFTSLITKMSDGISVCPLLPAPDPTSILDTHDWLTVLSMAPEHLKPVFEDPDVGIWQLFETTYGALLKDHELTLHFMKNNVSFPIQHKTLFTLTVLQIIDAEKPVKAAFRNSMTSDADKECFDVFAQFLKAQLHILRTFPYAPRNIVSVVDNLVHTVMTCGWMTRQIGFMRSHSQMPVEISTKKSKKYMAARQNIQTYASEILKDMALEEDEEVDVYEDLENLNLN